MSDSSEKQGIWKVISASSVGTLIEWYDFYIFGSLATIISKQFFPEEQSTAALLSTLAIFAAGFIVRPFGALVFGRLGDLIGRKYTFLLTLVLMGGSTFAIGLVPGYKTIGMWAPLIVLLLRLIQGLALGGEYGGAATYVAEHAPPGRRGFFTSWIQTTATLGLFLSLGVILLARNSLAPELSDSIKIFEDWGWRIPFWVSILLVGLSIYIRMKMHESPEFTRLKKSGKVSKNPLKESFGNRTNLKMVLLALFGAVMGQGVVWYTGQFYAQSFLENVCKLDFEQSRTILLWAILFATPFFVVFGSLSDKFGRKWIMLGGMLLAILTYRPIYQTFLDRTDVKTLTVAEEGAPKIKLSALPSGDSLKTSSYPLKFTDGSICVKVTNDTLTTSGEIKPAAKILYKDKVVNSSTSWLFIGLIFVLVLYVTMVYGPIAAFLVELFPTKIRYTSMSLPYHIGNGIFGGLVPFISTLIVELSKNPSNPGGSSLAGLWYPIGVAAVCFVIGAIYLTNKIDNNVMDDTNEYVHD
jgi:MFS family permease